MLPVAALLVFIHIFSLLSPILLSLLLILLISLAVNPVISRLASLMNLTSSHPFCSVNIRKIGPVAATRSYRLCREAIGKLEGLAARLKIHCGFERKPSLFLARHKSEIPDLREECELRRGWELSWSTTTRLPFENAFHSPVPLRSFQWMAVRWTRIA